LTAIPGAWRRRRLLPAPPVCADRHTPLKEIPLRVGMIGTGAISNMHARALKNIGYELTVCTDIHEEYGRKFAEANGCEFVRSYEEVCRHPRVDYVDVCTFPDFRLQPVELCAETKKHIQVQKPISTSVETARKMVEVARRAGITLGVVSQHRFDDSTIFIKKAIADGRLGKILQADAYVKWYRSAQYYSRPIKGSWATEGGGALINQAVHQVDILQYLVGGVKELFGYWQLGALHKIESEDVVNVMMRYENGATGVIQAATAFWPGYSERVEIHGTKGTAVLTGDKLTTWDVQDDEGDPAPVEKQVMSGASDPMAIPLTPFERQFLDFGNACKNGTTPNVSGEEWLRALEVVLAAYTSCREHRPVALG
jgi:UDP-N-acetyl-2-amino-2-deoxyglucuronate dehydrogenase